MKRSIIEIDEEKCDGCGLCVPNCAEGALQIIDGKARLISDLFCDGLGACIGHCPQGAIEVVEREAEAYNERKTMEKNIVPAGKNTIITHLKHLKDHNEMEYYNEGVEYLREVGKDDIVEELNNEAKEEKEMKAHSGGCPGAKMMDFGKSKDENCSSNSCGKPESELRQWPVQLHLVMPTASYYKNADVVLAADCVAFSMGNFHQEFLKGKALAIACPKLDTGMETYIEKMVKMIDEAKINTLTVIRMEVPCCGGLTSMAKEAAAKAQRKVPVKEVTVSIQGEVLGEEWI